MIYLIDDKKLRQEKDFGWTSSLLKQYSDILTPIYTLDELIDKATEVFKDNNTVLYHESFIDNSGISSQSAIKRYKLEEFAKTNPTFNLVIFSGSKNFRSIISNVAHLPVSIVYQNIKLFTEKNIAGDINLNYLAFGENPEVESLLIEKLENSLSEIEENPAVIPNQKNLFVSTNERYIENPIENAKEVTFFGEESDEDILNFIEEYFNDEVYDNLFIPLCFGKTLSDYNGLRLATYIRCTESRNRLTRIFIYGFVGYEYLFPNKYFNILKTKNVELINFSKKAIEKAALSKNNLLDISELSTEIKKLNLELPANYQDNHSIANEWAIYRWAYTIEAEDEAIYKIISRVENQLYFKYLLTIYPVNELKRISESQLKIDEKIKSKVLYIDDEADKGWYEILCEILYDINRFDFDYIGDELKQKTKNEIIESSMSKIINMDTDIVILDFRLHESDFGNDLKNVTGLKLLKKIKEYNSGIQVVLFSATNKIWNLQELQRAGADGFILKEAPENNSNSFTSSTLISFINTMQDCAKMNFLKHFFRCQHEIQSKLNPRKKLQHDNPLPKEFVDEVLKWLQLSNEIFLTGNLNESKIASSFLFKFSVLENISNRIIDVDNPIFINKDERGVNKYRFQFRVSERRLRSFIEDINNPGYYRKTNKVFESNRNLPWNIKILNTIDFITDEKLSEDRLTSSIKKRNDFIHANSTTGNKVDITIKDLIFLNDIIILGLNNIL